MWTASFPGKKTPGLDRLHQSYSLRGLFPNLFANTHMDIRHVLQCPINEPYNCTAVLMSQTVCTSITPWVTYNSEHIPFHLVSIPFVLLHCHRLLFLQTSPVTTYRSRTALCPVNFRLISCPALSTKTQVCKKWLANILVLGFMEWNW